MLSIDGIDANSRSAKITMTGDDRQPPYLLGHSAEELDRLEQQSAFFNVETRETLLSAGLAPGMTVLDIGCGAGDVAIAAAEIVGPSGRIHAIDTSDRAVAQANARFSHKGLHWAQANVADAHEVKGPRFDFAIGRFILMHLSDPAALLIHLKATLRPGGVLAFLEMDIGSATIEPPMPLFTAGVQAIVNVYRASGSEPNMGSRLYGAFRAAGLEPELRGSCRVEGGPDAQVYSYLVRSVASLAPAIMRHGIALPCQEPELYAAALRAEAQQADFSIAHPRLTAAWAHC